MKLYIKSQKKASVNKAKKEKQALFS